jgi:thiol-disulfide isomerase/thioredoxin
MIMQLARAAMFACSLLLLAYAPAHAQTVGEKARISSFELFDGTKFDPKTIEGKPTLVYFWASWCPHCQTEMPVLQRHFQTYKDSGFTILAINFREKTDVARAFIERIRPIDYHVGSINDDWRSDYPKVHGTPTWMLIDRKGVIRKVQVGSMTITGGWFDALVSDLKRVIAER